MTTVSTEHNKFIRMKTRIESHKLDIYFLKQCKKQRIFPKFVKINCKINNWRVNKAVTLARMSWLNYEISHHHSRLNDLNLDLYVQYQKLCSHYNDMNRYDIFEQFQKYVKSVVHLKTKTKLKRLNHKFKVIKAEQCPRVDRTHTVPQAIDNFVVNLSSGDFNVNELELLNKGLKFSIPPLKPPYEDVIVAVQSQMRDMNPDVETKVTQDSYDIISKLKHDYNPTIETIMMHNLVKSMKSKDVYITRADKSNNVVILDRDTYDDRVQNLINEGPYDVVDNDPINKLVNDVHKTINKHINVLIELINPNFYDIARPHDEFTFSKLTKSVRYTLKNRNPHVPILYCTTKLHKVPPDKMRPISSNIDAPCERIAKWLVCEFSKFPQPKSFSVKNGIEFVDRLKNVKVGRNEIMVSYDVESLYPSIPVDESVVLVRRWLKSCKVPEPYINMYFDLTELCMNQNYFLFRNKIYKQRYGTAMGNSLSSFIAEIFMANFETNASNDKRFPRVWIRYMDDIFAIMNKRKVDPTLSWLNSLKSTINFTKEEERDNKLPFLDILVINNNSTLEFDVYRKPTFTGRMITSDSFHNYSHKMAAMHSMAHRMVSLPLNSTRYTAETDKIVEIGRINGYPESTVRNIIAKHETKKRLLESSILFENVEEMETKRIVMPYLSHTNKQLSRMYRDNGFQMVNENVYSVQKLIGNAKDKIPDMLRSGIYEIGCQISCPFRYVGKSERNPTLRYNEHDYCVKKNDHKSAVAKHMNEFEHETDISNVELVMPVSGRNTSVFDCYEKIQIIKSRRIGPLMNQNDGSVNSILFDLV